MPVQPVKQPVDWIAIATPLVERGFRVTPVHPETKQGVMKNWSKHQATTVAEVIEFGKYYPHHCVGVVGKRGVDRDCFLDDDSGVATRIEQETGHKIPLTFTVQSRPQTNPRKAHYYFKQTDYSFHEFGKLHGGPWKSKNMNIRDLTKLVRSRKGHLMHPTTFDVKGIGGGSLVVGPGSTRADSDEIYTIKPGHDVAVVPLPAWLVDWFVQDYKKYVAGKNEERITKLLAKKTEREQYDSAERAKLRKENKAAGFDIYEEDISDFIDWRAGTYASLGMHPETIELALIDQVSERCVGGLAYVSEIGIDSGRDHIHNVAHNPELIRTGDASWFYKRRPEITMIGLQIIPAPRVMTPHEEQHQIMLKTVRTFPPSLTSSEIYARLAAVLLDSLGFVLISTHARHRKHVTDVLKECGYKAQKGGLATIWTRPKRPDESNPG